MARTASGAVVANVTVIYAGGGLGSLAGQLAPGHGGFDLFAAGAGVIAPWFRRRGGLSCCPTET